jgi:predicted O-methyltransferase YrrM
MCVPEDPLADMSRWSGVDDYFAVKLVRSDEIFDATLERNRGAGLPAYDVSAVQGKMLALFVEMTSAIRILEIGTLGGYSTLWMARALPPNGRIITIEANELHAKVAQQNIQCAGVADRVEMHVATALDVLPKLRGPFDLIFIDADKPNNPNYVRWALKLSRPGTVIIGDNVVRGGAIMDSGSEDQNVRGVREFVDIIAHEPRLKATAIQTVGRKGWDGFLLAVVVAG